MLMISSECNFSSTSRLQNKQQLGKRFHFNLNILSFFLCFKRAISILNFPFSYLVPQNNTLRAYEVVSSLSHVGSNINHEVTHCFTGDWSGCSYRHYAISSQMCSVLPEISVSFLCYTNLAYSAIHCKASVIPTHFSISEAYQLSFNHVPAGTLSIYDFTTLL